MGCKGASTPPDVLPDIEDSSGAVRADAGTLETLELLGILSNIIWPTWLGLVLLPSESTVTAVGLTTAATAVEPTEEARGCALGMVEEE